MQNDERGELMIVLLMMRRWQKESVEFVECILFWESTLLLLFEWDVLAFQGPNSGSVKLFVFSALFLKCLLGKFMISKKGVLFSICSWESAAWWKRFRVNLFELSRVVKLKKRSDWCILTWHLLCTIILRHQTTRVLFYALHWKVAGSVPITLWDQLWGLLQRHQLCIVNCRMCFLVQGGVDTDELTFSIAWNSEGIL